MEELKTGFGYRMEMKKVWDLYGGRIIDVMGLEGILLTANSVLQFRKIWQYVPFTMNDATSTELFRRIEDSPIFETDDFEDIFNNVFKMELRANEKLRELRRIYNSMGDCRKNDTRININSLVVISQSINPVKSSNIDNCFYLCSNLNGNIRNSSNQKESAHLNTVEEDHTIYVYTGDMNLKDNADFDRFEDKIRHHCLGKIGLIQVPHHGSITSYNKRLADNLSIACFTNFDPNRKVFDKSLPFKFAFNDKLLFMITVCDSSKFVQQINIV